MKHIRCDLSTVKGSLEAADKIPMPKEIHAVIFCVGITAPKKRETNDEGIEIDLMVSFISRKVILERLVERGMKKAKVFVMGKCGAERSVDFDNFNGQLEYSGAKQHDSVMVANDALVLGARKRFPNLKVYGLHPGVHGTEIRDKKFAGRTSGKVVKSLINAHMPSVETYARKIIPVIAAHSLSHVPIGKFLVCFVVLLPSKSKKDSTTTQNQFQFQSFCRNQKMLTEFGISPKTWSRTHWKNIKTTKLTLFLQLKKKDTLTLIEEQCLQILALSAFHLQLLLQRLRVETLWEALPSQGPLEILVSDRWLYEPNMSPSLNTLSRYVQQ